MPEMDTIYSNLKGLQHFGQVILLLACVPGFEPVQHLTCDEPNGKQGKRGRTERTILNKLPKVVAHVAHFM